MDMMLEQFKAIFDRPEKIKKLRETILFLAVRGKLVGQVKGSSSNQLLKNIIDAKEKFYKENYYKKAKILTNDSLTIPFTIPDEWSLICIGDLMELINGKAFKPTEWSSNGLPIIRIQNLNNTNAPFNYCDFEVDKKYSVKNNELLIGWSGTPGTSFGAFIWNRGEGVLNQHIFKGVPYLDINKEFLRIFINARLDEMIEKSHGGVGLKHITKGKFESMCIPLPSIEEQIRIIEKYNRLMKWCDNIERALNDKIKYGELVSKSLFNSINNISTVKELEETLKFILLNFKELSLGDNAVKELKNCILQLAVQGKLVPQDSNDESVDIILEKIKKEKEKLIKEKKIKKEKILMEISEKENKSKLPRGWRWTRLGYITNYGFNVSSKENEVDDNTWVLELEDIEKDTSKLLKKIMFKERKFKSTKLKFSKDDVLYCKLRPYLNKVIVAEQDGVCSSEIMPIRGYCDIYPRYLMYMLKRPEFIQYVNAITYGTKMPRLGTEDARKALIPLAPYNEQKRIVDKVDLLMGLCDELEEKIEKANKYSEGLMESIIKASISN